MSVRDWIADLFRRRRPPNPPSPPSPPGDEVAAMLAAHNSARAARGKPPLALDRRLCSAAQSHAVRMHGVGWLAHSGIGDGDPWSRIHAEGFSSSVPAAENIAAGYQDAGAVIRAWLADAPHAAIVLGDWTIAGFGRSGIYWCADYARP